MERHTYPDWLNENIIRKALGGSKTVLKIIVNPAAPKGEHFLSTILRANVEYKNNDHNKTREKTTLILKSLPPGTMKDFVNENGILAKEIKMYKYIIPLISDILGKYITPKYFESSNKDVLILEDLGINDFKNGNRIKGLDLHQCISAINALADFHGASYILNSKDPNIIECVKQEVLYTDQNLIEKQFISNSFKIVAEEIKNWPNCEKYSNRLFNVREKIWNQIVKEVLPDENEIMVLNHGDFWTNNILFRYDGEIENKIIEVKLIDFQFCRWSTPAVDLQIFFSISVRDKTYIPLVIDAYLERLNELIKPRNMTRKQLLEALHRTECIGMVVSVCLLPSLVLDPSKMIDIEKLNPDLDNDAVSDNPLCRIACKGDLYREIFPEYLKYYENIGLL